MTALDILESITGYSYSLMNTGAESLRLAKVDASYNPISYPSELPRVTFEEESTLSLKFYSVAGSYVPHPNDRVVMAPVGHSYVILGALNTRREPTPPDLSPLARGLVAENTLITNITGITSETNVVTISSVPLLASRKYVLHGGCRVSSGSGSGHAFQLYCFFGSNTGAERALARGVTIGSGTSGWLGVDSHTMSPYSPSSNQTINLTMTLECTTAGQNVRANASSGAPSFLRCYDIGPA